MDHKMEVLPLLLKELQLMSTMIKYVVLICIHICCVLVTYFKSVMAFLISFFLFSSV